MPLVICRIGEARMKARERAARRETGPRGTRAARRRRSARAARSSQRRSASCPTCIIVNVTYATFCQGPYVESARYRESWAGRCLGTRPPSTRSTLYWLDAGRLLPATGVQCLRDLLDDEARRRGDGQQLSVARLDRLRAAGDAGGFAHRLATTVGRQAAHAHRWTSYRPMVSSEGRVFGRPGNRQGLNRAYYFFDLPPKAATWHLRPCASSSPIAAEHRNFALK
jgi:hypothetical protein